ncbi:MAG: hypothetical protein ACK55I_51145, partial [bacterium]
MRENKRGEMQRAKNAYRWIGKKYSQDFAPVMADYWYAVRHHGAACKCFSGKQKDGKEEDEEEDVMEGQSDAYMEKIPARWTQRDVVSFVCGEVTMG